MKKILFILNSDFGIGHSIGARAEHIAMQIKKEKNLTIICRNYKLNEKKDYNLIKIFPKAEIFMKILTGLQIYISDKLPTNQVKNYVFDLFLLSKLKKLNLDEYSVVHSWDFLPKSFEYIKTQNPKIKLIQDLPMALADVNGNFLKKDANYNYVLNSINYVDLFIVPSPFVSNSLKNINIFENKIKMVPFGVDVLKFKPIKKLNEKFKVAFCGNVNKRKGIPLLIESWKNLNLKNAELNIYGRVYPEVKKYLTDKEKYNIFVHGFVDITKELPKNHIFVFPSHLEGSAKAVYEALASGLPVITTENAGSVIKNGKEGFIINVNDLNALNEKIMYFYNNREQISIYGKKARLLSQKYTWEKYGKEVYLNYK